MNGFIKQKSSKLLESEGFEILETSREKKVMGTNPDGYIIYLDNLRLIHPKTCFQIFDLH
jgi:hypothetical protein